MSEKVPQRRNVNSRGHVTKLLPADQTENADRASAGRTSRVRERIQRRNDDAQRFPQVDWTWGVIGAAVVGVLCLVSLVVAMASRQAPAAQPTTGAAVAVTFTPGPSATPDYNIRAWDGQSRFTILLMGLDKRPSEQGTGFRTDTMILISIDPKAGQLGLLSLPRDVYVPLPGSSDMQQINRVFILGELERPGFGPRKLADVVQYNLGMPIHSYVAISFETFITAIDTIGGVDIDVPTAINDPEYPDMNFGYEPLFIPAGRIHMDGKLALKYARTRHQSDDFDRNKRQQQLLLAVRQQALTPDVLAKLAGNAPGLWNSVSGGVLTDLKFEQLLSLAWYLKDLPADKLRRGAVEREFILATQLDGNPILTINRTNIATLLTHVFGADYNR